MTKFSLLLLEIGILENEYSFKIMKNIKMIDSSFFSSISYSPFT
jgi:hypothetical protein